MYTEYEDRSLPYFTYPTYLIDNFGSAIWFVLSLIRSNKAFIPHIPRIPLVATNW